MGQRSCCGRGHGLSDTIRSGLPKPLARPYRALLALMTGTPSVVLGLWGLGVLVPIVARWQPPGASALTAALVLTLMVLPTVALTSAAALRSLPKSWLLGAAALGFSRTTIVLRIALPAARRGIGAGVLLGPVHTNSVAAAGGHFFGQQAERRPGSRSVA
jgi:ABC-type phosphate transport system permease subunit